MHKQSLSINSSLQDLATTNLFSVCIHLRFVFTGHFIKMKSFSMWPLCLAPFTWHEVSQFIPGVACISISILYGWIIFHCVDAVLSVISPSPSGHLSCLHLLCILLLWTFMYKILCEYVLNSLEFVQRNEIIILFPRYSKNNAPLESLDGSIG